MDRRRRFIVTARTRRRGSIKTGIVGFDRRSVTRQVNTRGRKVTARYITAGLVTVRTHQGSRGPLANAVGDMARISTVVVDR